MPDFPDDELEFSRCWSSAAGALSALKEAVAEAENRSAQAFIRKRDEVANALRDLATALTQRVDTLSKKLEEFIAEDKRRSWERTKMLRH